jgi:hypothetical protein
MSPPSSLPPLSASMTPPSSGASTTSIYTNSSDRPVKRTRSREPPSRSSVETTLADSTNRLVLATSTHSPPPRIKQQSRTPSPLTPNSSTLPPASAPAAAPDFSHVDLMYVRRQSSLVCRACLLEKPKPSSTEPKVFPSSASWDELRDHCIRMHPEACADVARLHPAEIFELRRRLSL